MKLDRQTAFVVLCLIVAWAWDQLFWKQALGVNFALWVALLVVAGLWFTRQQGASPSRASLLLLIPIAFFSVMTFIRAEPLTTFLNVVATLLLLGLFAHSYLGGRWWGYGLADYAKGAFQVGLDAISRQIVVFSQQEKDPVAAEGEPRARHTAFGVLRGLLLAIPVLLIFTLLLSQADPIFDQGVRDFFAFFRIENVVELIWRAILICILAYILSGVYLHSLRDDNESDLLGDRPGWLPRFLGFTEAAVVLGTLNLLFISFVVIQFQYFFGGSDSLESLGYTYAEYARRGFGELVTVAFFALLLYLAFSAVTKREAGAQQTGFSLMGVLMALLVGVMLVSSWQRLMLYEGAYGFTRLRTYTHLFIPWLGALLIVVVALEATGRQRYLALVMLVAGLGFVATLNIANVDALIVRRNLARADHTIESESTGDISRGGDGSGRTTDIYYLANLSTDAIPPLARAFTASAADSVEREVIAGAIACHSVWNDPDELDDKGWRGYHLSRSRAAQQWATWQQRPDFEQLFVPTYDEQDYVYWVTIDGQPTSCYGYDW